MSSPLKFTMCFAEWEEGSPWSPLHVERGFQVEDFVVTVFAMTSGPVLIVDQESRGADQIAGSLGLGLEGAILSKIHRMPMDALLVVCPEHIRTLTSEGQYSKDRLRSRNPAGDLASLEGNGRKRNLRCGHSARNRGQDDT